MPNQSMDLKKYELMRDAGADPHAVCAAAYQDGIGTISRIKMLRAIYDLSLVEAKEISIVAEGEYSSLNEYQERLYEEIAAYLDIDVDDDLDEPGTVVT